MLLIFDAIALCVLYSFKCELYDNTKHKEEQNEIPLKSKLIVGRHFIWVVVENKKHKYTNKTCL